MNRGIHIVNKKLREGYIMTSDVLQYQDTQLPREAEIRMNSGIW